MSQIRIGRYVAPKADPDAYAVIASITRDGKAMIRILDDERHMLCPYDPNDLVLLPRGVVKVKMKRPRKAQP